jgi:hypothetical protein
MEVTKCRKKETAWRYKNDMIVALVRNERAGKRSRRLLKMGDMTRSVNGWETRSLRVHEIKDRELA